MYYIERNIVFTMNNLVLGTVRQLGRITIDYIESDTVS